MVGFSQSLIVTVKLQLDELPVESVAVQFTVVVPGANVEFEGGLQLLLKPGQLPAADSVNVTTALHCPSSVHCVICSGHVSVGFSH